MSELEIVKQTINAEPITNIGDTKPSVCGICGQLIIGYEGCDPTPVIDKDACCCSDCFKRYVEPARRKAKKTQRQRHF